MQGLCVMAVVLSTALAVDNNDAAPTPKGRVVTVEEALKIASTRQPALLAARARMEASVAGAHSLRGRLLPSIHVSASESWYHTGVYISPPLLMGANPNALSAFPDNVRSGIVSVAASQPLLGLIHMSQDYAAASNSADASVEQLKATESEMHARIKTYFLRMFEARALGDTATASQHDLEEQVNVAQRKVDAGALTTADVLRLQVAAANAKQQAISAKSQEITMRAALSETLGLPDDVEFGEPQALQEVAPPTDLATSKADAMQKRPEIAAQTLSARAAKQRANAKSWAMLPEVDALASYMWVGVSPFDSKLSGVLDVKAGSLGISAKWALWEWGASYYDQSRAQSEASAAALEAQDAVEQIRAEVAGRRADVIAAMSAVEVAQVQVASAQEAYRVMQALMSAGSATTTDLLDAQSALTEARMNLVHARYEAAVASVALQRATGNDQ